MGLSYAQNQGTLSALNSLTANVSDMITPSPVSCTTTSVTDTLAKSNTSNSDTSSRSAVNTVNQRKKTAVVKANAFVSQTAKSAVNPVTFDTATAETTELAKLSSNEIASLSEFSSIDITSDATLKEALEVSSTKLSSLLDSSSIDLNQDVDLDVSEVSSIAENIKSSAESAVKSAPSILGVGEEIYDKYVDSPNVTDMAGNIIDGIPATSDFTQTSAIDKKLASLCSSSSMSLLNFNTNLNLFNALLALAAKLGLSSILRNISNCSTYFNKSGVDILKKVIPDVAVNGDTITMATIAELTGTGSVSDPIQTITKMIQNSPDTTVSHLDTTMQEWSVTSKDLTDKTIPDSDYTVTSITKLNNLGTNDVLKTHLVGAGTMALLDKVTF